MDQPGMYTVVIDGKKRKNLTYGDALRAVNAAFINGGGKKATFERQ